VEGEKYEREADIITDILKHPIEPALHNHIADISAGADLAGIKGGILPGCPG
jgi:hypothetical protein